MVFQEPAKFPIYKTVLLGNGGVGKTSLRKRFIGEKFIGDYKITIGADFAIRQVTLEPTKKEVIFQIWDLAGQARFETIRRVYYQGAHGALMVFDVTQMESFENTPQWINECWKHSGHKRIPLILLGNKIDLRGTVPDPAYVSTKQGERLAQELGKILKFPVWYFETSALTGENVSDAFQALGQLIEKYREI
ncbi:MAG: Rab family GTPase [Promethearchaeota archaeon]